MCAALMDVPRLLVSIKRALQTVSRSLRLRTGDAKTAVLKTTSIADRVVSVFDPEARPIRRGKVSMKTEFGYNALLTETEDRIMTHYEVHVGNPEDSRLAAAPAGHMQTVQRTPQVVAADRGFGSKDNEVLRRAVGINQISLPYKGRLGARRLAHERQRWFRRQQPTHLFSHYWLHTRSVVRAAYFMAN